MTNFAYEIYEGMMKRTELSTLDNTSWIGFGVEKLTSILLFLVVFTLFIVIFLLIRVDFFPASSCFLFCCSCRIKICTLGAHACKIYRNSINHCGIKEHTH